MTELPDSVHTEITKLSDQADGLAEAGSYANALQLYWRAWELLPEPKTKWEASTWLLTAIGDANFLAGDFAAGRDNLSNALQCPNAVGNPFIHLRLGQCRFELGENDRAADELMRAYMGAGREIFSQDDPKYLRFLSSRAKGIDSPKSWWQFWKR